MNIDPQLFTTIIKLRPNDRILEEWLTEQFILVQNISNGIEECYRMREIAKKEYEKVIINSEHKIKEYQKTCPHYRTRYQTGMHGQEEICEICEKELE
jgi:hypothetical protein